MEAKKDDKKDEELVFTEVELFQMDFVSKLSIIIIIILLSVAVIIQNLLSVASNDDVNSVILSFNQLTIFFMICTAAVVGLVLLIPIVYESLLYIIEDKPDKKIQIQKDNKCNKFGTSMCKKRTSVYYSTSVSITGIHIYI